MLKLGLRLELYRSPTVQVPYDLVQRAEELGFHSVWTAEAYGADALTPLAAIAATHRAHQARHRGRAAGRPSAGDARHAGDDDRRLAGGGRMIVGIGLSGPQIVEGWYGQPWGKPNARLRDYVEILRDVLRREGPVTHDGPEISLPYDGPGALGQGKALKSILHPPSDIPIWLASVGPTQHRAVRRAVRRMVADGPPARAAPTIPTSAASLDRGFARRTDGRRRRRLRRVQRPHGRRSPTT